MYKYLMAGGVALFAAVALQPAAVRADTQIGITLGGAWPPAQYYPAPAYDPAYDDDYDDDYISCSEGRRIVRDYGFREVRPMRCGGGVYRYQAVKRYQLWSVRVSARSGRIISARVIGDDY